MMHLGNDTENATSHHNWLPGEPAASADSEWCAVYKTILQRDVFTSGWAAVSCNDSAAFICDVGKLCRILSVICIHCGTDPCKDPPDPHPADAPGSMQDQGSRLF